MIRYQPSPKRIPINQNIKIQIQKLVLDHKRRQPSDRRPKHSPGESPILSRNHLEPDILRGVCEGLRFYYLG